MNKKIGHLALVVVLAGCGIYFVYTRGQWREDLVLAPAPIPLPGPGGQAPVPPPARLPLLRDVAAVEPIVIETVSIGLETLPLLPPEIADAIPVQPTGEETGPIVAFMPQALEDFDTPVRRMPYADEMPPVAVPAKRFLPLSIWSCTSPLPGLQFCFDYLFEWDHEALTCEESAQEALAPETKMPDLLPQK